MTARSEIYKILRIAAIVGTVSAACSPRNSSPGEIVPVQPTPISSPLGPELSPQFLTSIAVTFAPTLTARSTSMPETATMVIMPTGTEVMTLPVATLTPIPTEMTTVLGTEEEFSHQEMSLDISSTYLELHNKVVLVPFYSETDEERRALNRETAPGKGTAATYIQPDGSLLIVEHSGYYKGKKLQAEDLRRYLEGGNDDVATFSDSDVVVRMRALVGAETLLTINGVTSDYQVVMVQKLDYGGEINKFRQDGNVALSVAAQLDRDKHGNVSVLDSFEGQFIGINFCGWAREDQLDQLGVPADQWEFNGYIVWLMRQ